MTEAFGRTFSKENTQISSLGLTPTNDLVQQWLFLFLRPPSVLPYPRIMAIRFSHFSLSYLNAFQNKSDSEKLASMLKIKSRSRQKLLADDCWDGVKSQFVQNESWSSEMMVAANVKGSLWVVGLVQGTHH